MEEALIAIGVAALGAVTALTARKRRGSRTTRPSGRPKEQGGSPKPGSQTGGSPKPGGQQQSGGASGAYPGDYTGKVRTSYNPKLDGAPDTGEIVWTWVPYEDDPSQGKDRPVLLIGADGKWLLGLMLTSKDHSRDAADEARWGRRWMDIGAGEWDRQRRDSEVRLDRVIRIDPAAVRREGAVMKQDLFNRIVDSL